MTTPSTPDQPGSRDPDPGAEVVSLDAARADRTASGPADAVPADVPVLEGEIVRVDQPGGAPGDWLADLAARSKDRRPIIPAWLRSRREALTTLKWVSGHYLHVGGYHATRVPKYGAKLAVRTPRGLARVAAGMTRWMLDLEGHPVRMAAVLRADPEAYLKLSRQRDARVRLRVWIAGLALLAVLAVAVVAVIGPPVARWAAVALAVVVFGTLGGPADRPLIDRAVVPSSREKLTSDIVIRALGALGIAAINQAVARDARTAIEFKAPIARDGPGWRADVDLPYGVTVAEVMDRRDKLASGLRRPLGLRVARGRPCPAPRPPGAVGRGPGHVPGPPACLAAGPPRRHRPVQAGAVRHRPAGPVRGGDADVRLGDHRLHPTDGQDVPAAAAGADRRPGRAHAAAPVRLQGHRRPVPAGAGRAPLPGRRRRRGHRLRAGRLPRPARGTAAPHQGDPRPAPRHLPGEQGHPELASRKSLGLHPIVIGVDECQVMFEHPAHGSEFEDICTDLTKRGPALAMLLILATQRPDAKSLPTGISANAVLRMCLKVMGQVENDMVLGTSAYKNGVRATMFAFSDKGICYFAGEGEAPRIVRSIYLDAPAAEKIALRARGLREHAGTLSGHALGQEPDTGPTFDLLADLAAVVTEPKLWSETAVTRLAALRPDAYQVWADLEPDARAAQLTAALRPYGVRTGQVWGTTEDGKGANRRGITRDDITTAITERDRKRAPAPVP